MANNTKSEAAARVSIDAMLRKEGWRLPGDANANVELEGDFRNPAIKRALAGKRPDYHLYTDESSTIPLAFVEAKKDGLTIQQGLTEGRERVRKVLEGRANATAMLLFVSDGSITVGEHSNGQRLRIGGIELDAIPRQGLVEELIANPNISAGKALKNAEQLVKIFKDASNDFRQDGLDAGSESLLEFSKLLFLKIMSDRGDTAHHNAREQWRELNEAKGQAVIRRYSAAIQAWRQSYGEIFQEPRIRKPGTLEKLIAELDAINFTDTSMDIKGNAYEWFLTRYSGANTSDLGQYFTPRHITRMMAKLLEPKFGDTIYDPFTGTGGMLIACYEEIFRQMDADASAAHLAKLKEQTLYGDEITRNASALAKMNMIIIGDGHANITMADSLETPKRGAHDIVITNIPFNMNRPAPATRKLYANKSARQWPQAPGIDANETCILHCLDAVRKGGKAAMIVPESILFLPKYAQLRKYTAARGRIRAVIRLPQGLFQPYTSAVTAIVAMDKIGERRSAFVPVVETIKDGFTLETQRKPSDENQIPEIIEAFRYERISDIAGGVAADSADGWSAKRGARLAIRGESRALGELLKVRTRKQRLEPGLEYCEPALNSETNTVSVRGKPKLGRNIKGEKIFAQPGDLIIGALHTQRGNGLFAFADREYICTSQIVAEVDTQKISREYLKLALQQVLPTLKDRLGGDLVGRETYTKEQILGLRIPVPAQEEQREIRETEEQMQAATEKLDALRNALRARVSGRFEARS